ncbi:hypothetical protein [Stutzerimonas stutzeri]|uniref:Uncharacterized protein n=1 Tax=Stutzerimonas stutzeri KOS6 TaxID=1218352 RepID=A0A061JQ57_STUST|nr:hypothetical protein [Stutzerimonas stutzeri]EWC41842.1 hypothetical protein B597_007905 [Stutzerimonas stutzeri KOS6]
MNGKRSGILYLHQRAPDAALDALNRLTGLCFSQWPESLVERSAVQCDERPSTPEVRQVEPKKVSG